MSQFVEGTIDSNVHVEAKGLTNAAVNCAIIGWGNSLCHVRCKAVTHTNPTFCNLDAYKQNSANRIPNILFQENSFENVICKMVVIFFVPNELIQIN